jgi:tetratricopeptide (TPR) repeat protein
VGLQDFIEPRVERLVAEVQAVNTRQALQMGEILWKRLETEPEATRRSLVESRAAYHQWPLCLFLCDESEKKAADDAGEARKLAELALIVAQRLRHTDLGNERFYVRLESRAEAVLANALRVLGHLDSAESAFGRAWTLWAEGIDEAHLLSEAQMLDLEASLHRARRRFAQALRRHTEALELARPEEVASILLNKAMTLEVQGDHASALADLARAEPLIDAESPPRLRWVLKQNEALNLVRLGRAEEAQPVVAEARRLVELLGNGLDLARTAGLGALVDAGLGRREAAIESLEKVCSDLDENGYAFDYALVALDLALLYREERRWAEIRVLASRMLDIFRGRKIHRETIAAVLLFQKAAEREAVSAELVRRLQDYLKQAREQPGLRFEP